MKHHLPRATVKVLTGTNKGESFDVQFNPAEYSVEYSNSFQETAPPGLNNPILSFVNGNAQVLAIDLLFDTWTDGGGTDVSAKTREFTGMIMIDGTLHAPPIVQFSWGGFDFKAIVEKISERFTMFNADGKPVRANLSVTFKQYQTIAEQLKNPKRESADKTKRRVLESHDSVWLMAAREYGEARFWRLIARANRIENPLRVVPGTVLTLLPFDQFEEVTGS